MILMTAETRILLATHAQDFRKGFDGFIAACQLELKKDPRSGALFVFINRSKTMIRVLTFDGSGYWLMTKRLSKGTYRGWPTSDASVSALDAKQLQQLLWGPESVKHSGSHWRKVSS